MIGNIVLNGGALPPNVQQQLANQFNNQNFLDFGNEAAQAFGENVARLTSRVVDQWKFYLLGMGAQGQDIKALLLYMPNLIGGPQLPPIPVRRGRLPMEVVFGGNGTLRLFGAGVRVGPLRGTRGTPRQMFRMEFNMPPIPIDTMNTWTANDPFFKFIVEHPP